MLSEPPFELWRQCHEGDIDARQSLIEAYLPLTRLVASQMYRRLPPSVEFDELVSYGTLGLIDAITKYDPSKNVRFATYAVSRVRGAILDELRALDWVPRSVRTKARSIEQTEMRLSHLLGRSPTDQEMADEMGLTSLEYHELAASASTSPLTTLDDVRGGDDERQSVIDMVIDRAADDPLSLQIDAEVATTVAALVANLDERQKTILALYCVEELTLSEIGTVLGVTESRVCQMHTRAVAAIQGFLEARGAGIVPAH